MDVYQFGAFLMVADGFLLGLMFCIQLWEKLL